MAKGGPAVTIVSNGGLPVTQVSGGNNASPFTVVTNGGFPVTLVSALGIAVALYDTSGNEYDPTPGDGPSMNFSIATNSQLIAVLEDF